jgi:transglutaminase superfamily protein
MPVLTIRHVTTYRYRQPVSFGEHRMMLRPRDSSDQRLLEASFEISPEPKSLRFIQDGFGNHLGIARFSGQSERLQFKSTMCLEHSPVDVAGLEIEEYARTVPFAYSDDELSDVAHCIERHHSDPENEVGRWARQFRPADAGTIEFLARLNKVIHRELLYRRRRRINDAMVPPAVIEVYYMDNLEGAVTTAIEMACNRPFERQPRPTR